jgi:hypothetical protein
VVVLCAEGMAAEAQQQFDTAKSLFQRAWDEHQDDYEAAIAAHYLARHQDSDERRLHWNQRALEHALAAPVQQVETFVASLYLNLAHSHEKLDRPGDARHYLTLAEAHVDALPASSYRAVVLDGLSRMRERVEEAIRCAPTPPGAGRTAS